MQAELLVLTLVALCTSHLCLARSLSLAHSRCLSFSLSSTLTPTLTLTPIPTLTPTPTPTLTLTLTLSCSLFRCATLSSEPFHQPQEVDYRGNSLMRDCSPPGTALGP